MFVKKTISNLLKDAEIRKDPVIIRVNSFDEESAAKFIRQVGEAHNTGQPIIPIVIDSYGGQVYSLMAMISAIKNSSFLVDLQIAPELPNTRTKKFDVVKN